MIISNLKFATYDKPCYRNNEINATFNHNGWSMFVLSWPNIREYTDLDIINNL